MGRFTIACVQQRTRLPFSLDEYRENLRRLLRSAENKRAHLVVFPELAGLMVVPPLLGDFRSSLLKRADRGRRRSASFWQKWVGWLAHGAAGMLRADFRSQLAGLLDIAAPSLWLRYTELFGGLAREFALTVVAPSAYLPDPRDGVIRNLAAVFGPEGTLLGTQAKVLLTPEDQFFCQPALTWNAIPTPVGSLGLMIGGDVLFPEVGRLLAFQGAEALVVLAASNSQAQYHKLRSGALARMQDNQIFAACSFLVGPNFFANDQAPPYLGKSALLAPQELTLRGDGVLAEIGHVQSEGVLVEAWDFDALHTLWAKNGLHTRSPLDAAQVSQLLATIYRQLQSSPQPVPPSPQLTAGELSFSKTVPLALDDLSVMASVTSRWPLHLPQPEGEKGAATVHSGMRALPPETISRYEEETDEMDALEDKRRSDDPLPPV